MHNNLQQINTNGFLVLDNFMTAEDCDALMQRAEELATGFTNEGHPSIFQTTQQTKTSDDYFLNSGGNISFFFEKDAFDTNCNYSLLAFVLTIPKLNCTANK